MSIFWLRNKKLIFDYTLLTRGLHISSMLWYDEFSWNYGPLIKLVFMKPVNFVHTNSLQLLVEFKQSYLQFLCDKARNWCNAMEFLSTAFFVSSLILPTYISW